MENAKLRIITFAVWLIALCSLLGVHFLIRKPPRNKGPLIGKAEFLDKADNSLKTNIRRYENAFLKLDDGKFHFIGIGYENYERALLENQELIVRKIDIPVSDPIALERKMMVGEAVRTLNNAEKIAYADGYGTIFFRDGIYYYAVDSRLYNRYASKYGTECGSCPGTARADSTKKGR